MHNLDDFREKVNEPLPDDKKPVVIVFPEKYLSKINLYVVLGLLITIGVYVLHIIFPVILNVFYNDINNIEIQESPFAIMCIVLPIIVPLVVSQYAWSPRIAYQIGFLVLMATILGSTLAFLCVAINGFVLTLLVVYLLAHSFLALLQSGNPTFSQGRYATGILIFLVFVMMLIADLIGEINYVGWIITLVSMTVTIYVGHNTSTMKRALNGRESKELLQQKIAAQGLGQFLLFMLLVYPHAFITKGFTPIYTHRRWMGPEDGR